MLYLEIGDGRVDALRISRMAVYLMQKSQSRDRKVRNRSIDPDKHSLQSRMSL